MKQERELLGSAPDAVDLCGCLRCGTNTPLFDSYCCNSAKATHRHTDTQTHKARDRTHRHTQTHTHKAHTGNKKHESKIRVRSSVQRSAGHGASLPLSLSASLPLSLSPSLPPSPLLPLLSICRSLSLGKSCRRLEAANSSGTAPLVSRLSAP